MESVQKGNQWYFGMKAHIGVDSQTKLIHSVMVTSAYTGQKAQIKSSAKQAKDFTRKRGRRNYPLTEKNAKLIAINPRYGRELNICLV